MHDSDELDDILNEIRNRQNPHTEDAPPEPEPPQTVDMPLFDQADAPAPAPKDLPENPTLPTEAAEETPAAPAMPEAERARLLSGWHKAVGRSSDWAEHEKNLSGF